jgi:hypothetical protein
MKRCWLLIGLLLGCSGCPWLKVVADLATTVKDVCGALGTSSSIRSSGPPPLCRPADMGLTDAADLQ